MAIKIQGTTVIDDSRNATALTELSFDTITLNGTTVVASANEINRLDGVTGPINDQLGTLAKNRGTLNKTFTTGETATITLDPVFSGDEIPALSVTKEVPQIGLTTNDWDVAADGSNFTLHDTAYDTTLTPDVAGPGFNTASYDNVSFDISSEADNPRGITFNDDGSKMYTIDSTSDSVYQYTLSTAFDLSTASYDNASFDISSEDSAPQGIVFNNNGSKMYIVAIDTASVYQYTLSTAFDLSTASYDNIFFDISGQDTNPVSITFNNDGSKMYVIGFISDSVHQYTLSTAFDLSTASYDNVSFNVSSETGFPKGIAFNNDGSKMYMINNSTSVFQYSLGTAFDISTASYDNISFGQSSEFNDTEGIAFNNDDTKMYVVDRGAPDSVYQYSLGIAFDQFLVLGSGSFAAEDVGKRIVGNGGEAVLTGTDGSYELQTPFNDTSTIAAGDWSMFGLDVESVINGLQLSSSSLVSSLEATNYDNTSFDTSAQVSFASGVEFNNDGTKMYISDGTLYQYSLSTPNDVSTATYDNFTFFPTQASNGASVSKFNNEGTKLFIFDASDDSIYQYSLSNAFDLSSSITYEKQINITTYITYSNQFNHFTFNNEGTSIYFGDTSRDRAEQWELSAPYDIGTIGSRLGTLEYGEAVGGDAGVNAFEFNSDGTKLYVIGRSNELIYQFSLSTPFSVSTGTYDNISLSISGRSANATGLVFSSDYSKLYFSGNTTVIYQYDSGFEDNKFASSGNHTAVTSTSIDSEFWTDINSMTADDTLNDGAVYYAVSTDDRTTWSIIDDTNGVRNIVRNNAGTWEVNDASDYSTETWVAATENDEFYALEEAATVTVNRMDSTQLNAVSDGNHYTLGNDLDLAITLFMADGNTNSPTSDGVLINYDANALNQSAIPGTDYEYDYPSNDTVRFTALSNENFKIRVV